MKRNTINKPAKHRLAHLGNERGMLLVITMLILLVVSSIAAASLINSFLERSLARNQSYASIAQSAADAGITAGLAWLNDADTPAAQITGLTTTWAQKLSGSFDLTTKTGQSATAGQTLDQTKASSFVTYVRQKPDEQDIDGDGNFTEKVLYNSCMAGNNCFKYPNSTYKVAGQGYPVIQIKAEGKFGEGGIREVILEIGRDKFDVKAKGAVTASASVQTTGNIGLDGRSHDINGALGGNCTDSYAGVSIPCPSKDADGDCVCDVGDVCPTYTASGASASTGKIDLNGDGDFLDPGEDPAASTLNNTDPSISPDDALGLDEGDLADKFAADFPDNPGESALYNEKIAYYNKDKSYPSANVGFTDPISGVLIVHNPKFEPQKWEVSDPAAGPKFAPVATLSCADRIDPTKWTTTPLAGYPSLSALLPSYDRNLDTGCPGNFDPVSAGQATQAAYRAAAAPRKFEMNATDTFKGLIVADVIDKVNGTADIIGAVVSLSTVNLDTIGNGSAKILYSCDALALATDVGYSIKLNWHRTR